MNSTRFIIWVVILLSQISLYAQTNEGTEFWFSFLEHRNPGLNTKVVMITSRFNTSGIITAPLAGYSRSFTVNANQVTIVELPTYAETIGSESITNNGFRVQSNDLVSIYIHQYHEYRAEATVVLPVSTIGHSYYALSYAGYFTEGQLFPSEFAVVANEDDTRISIRLSANTQAGRRRGSTFEITLNAGEVYQIQGAEESDDLSGSFMTSDKNFSLFCGNKYSALNCFRGGRDNLLEQGYPISTWGTRFVSVPFQKGIRDVYRILASENNTRVNVFFENGTESNYLIDEGEFIEFDDARNSYIESNRPILVAQYMNQLDCGNGSTGDPSMLYLNSILQIRDTVTLYNSSFQNILENYINIITRTDDIPNITFDGQLLSIVAPTIEYIGRNNEFASVTLAVNTGAHTIISEGCGVIAKAYGLGIYESYAYSGGARFTKLNASPIPDGGCLNDTVFFDTELPADRFDVQWVFEPGDTVREHQFTRMYPNLGSYNAELFIHDKCFDLFDTLQKDLQITLRQSVATEPLDQYCAGDTIEFSATDVAMASYEWTGPEDYFSEEQHPNIVDAQPEMSGIYQVIGIVSGCATFPAEVDLDIRPSPLPDLGSDAVFCPKDEMNTVISPGDFAAYQWQDGSSEANYIVDEEGSIEVLVTDEYGCMAVDVVNFIQQCPTVFYIPNIFSPNNDQINDHFGVIGEDIISLELTIYDRWGTEIFRTTDEHNYWDGRHQDKNVAEGVYTWLLQLQGYEEDGSMSSKLSRGSITLIR